MNLTAIEQALLPVIAPFLTTLWNGTLSPALSAVMKSGSPEIQIIETQVIAMLDAVFTQELAKLQSTI